MARKARQRYFLANGREVAGTTTILNVINKPALVGWANKMGLKGVDTTRHVDDLATIGTLAHGLIQAHLTKTQLNLQDYTPNQVDKAENAVLSYLEWERRHTLETIFAEKPLVSEALEYGGTPDWFGKLDGRLVLLDFKTSRGIYEDFMYQLGGYWNLVKEQGYEPEEARILRVGRAPNEGFEERLVPIESLPGYFKVFEAALVLHNAIKAAKDGRD